ncbi:hypothetical protein QAD02_003711 [Eretmocerus hayati]|uniref:Uncharacterized protein n=1 Tax=Eretmocerus hayati TaxID=131215 RepID=A0ACC2NMX9_9HYME|nr:hypothetical protein QAD02_003711 [Eretmocerus hayati]
MNIASQTRAWLRENTLILTLLYRVPIYGLLPGYPPTICVGFPRAALSQPDLTTHPDCQGLSCHEPLDKAVRTTQSGGCNWGWSLVTPRNQQNDPVSFAIGPEGTIRIHMKDLL